MMRISTAAEVKEMAYPTVHMMERHLMNSCWRERDLEVKKDCFMLISSSIMLGRDQKCMLHLEYSFILLNNGFYTLLELLKNQTCS